MVNADYDEGRDMYTLHMANTFSKTEYHLTVGKNLFDEMFKNQNTFDSTKELLRNGVVFNETKAKG